MYVDDVSFVEMLRERLVRAARQQSSQAVVAYLDSLLASTPHNSDLQNMPI